MQKVAEININLSEEFNNEVALHVDVMRQRLADIESDAPITQRRRDLPITPPIEFQKSPSFTKQWAIQQQIDSTFLAIVRSAINFMDMIIGLKTLVSKPFQATKDIETYDELVDYFSSEIAKNAVAVGRMRNLSNPQKVERIGGLTPFLERSILGMIEARRVIEHHKSVVERDFEFATLRVQLLLDGIPETRPFPFPVSKGQLVQFEILEHAQEFRAGEQIRLSEVDIDEVALTLTQGIVPLQIQGLNPNSAEQDSHGSSTMPNRTIPGTVVIHGIISDPE